MRWYEVGGGRRWEATKIKNIMPVAYSECVLKVDDFDYLSG